MKKVFDLNGGFYHFLSQLYELLLLNVLILLASLPLVTIASAMITGYELLATQKLGENKAILGSFWEKFQANCWLGIKIEGLFVVILGVGASLTFVSYQTPLLFLSLLLLAAVLLFSSNLLLTVAHHKLTKGRALLSYSIFITIKYTGYFCIGMALFLSTFLIPIFLPKLLFLWLFLGISLPMLLQEKIYAFCDERLQERLSIEKGAA